MEDSQNLSKNQCIFVKINVFLYTTLDPIPLFIQFCAGRHGPTGMEQAEASDLLRATCGGQSEADTSKCGPPKAGG